MRVGIMQPYFLPYLGYFQLIGAVDRFVIYDTIKYTKKGWINRNQMLVGGKASMFSIPLRKGSDYLNVFDRYVSDAYNPEKLSAQITGAYRKAPQFSTVMPVIDNILSYPSENLFDFIQNSLVECCDFLELRTPLLTASEVEEGVSEKTGEERVIDICNRLSANTYINPPGGRALYEPQSFSAHGLDLQFIDPRLSPYTQFGQPFVPYLSILDVMMFNPAEHIHNHLLKDYALGHQTCI